MNQSPTQKKIFQDSRLWESGIYDPRVGVLPKVPKIQKKRGGKTPPEKSDRLQQVAY